MSRTISLLSIIVPAYNEASTIEAIIGKILAVPFQVPYEIVIVDDFSTDGTYEIAQAIQKKNGSERIKIFKNSLNCGKGFSIRQGMGLASGDALIIQDADFEYEPSDIPNLLEPMLNGGAMAVFGSRFSQKGWPDGMAFANMVANRFLTSLTNLLFGCRLSDMETCYKLIRRDALKGIRLSTQRFDFEPEITCKLVQQGVEIIERPIRYRGRTAGEGKKIKARDFFIAIRVLFQNKFFSAREHG